MAATPNPASTFKEAYAARLEIVTRGVEDFAQMVHDQAADEDVYTQAALNGFVSLMERGGKRTRGVLALTGYDLYGGTNAEVASVAAGVIEACHAYLLVMDDVADNSALRRGGPTAHVQMADFLAAHKAPGDPVKIGKDMAEMACLYAQHKAQSRLLGLDVPFAQRARAVDLLNDGLARTGIGQLRDISPLGHDDMNMDHVLGIATYKTAYYSYLLPLQVGATLAGAPADELVHFDSYSLNAGLAFQLHDDIMGTFGSETATGKPQMSDIIEGKKTALVAKTLEHANEQEKTVLLAALGNPALKASEFAECLDIMRRTGALDEIRALVTHHVDLAMSSLDQAPSHWSPRHVQFLRDLAIYGAKREA
ncbi:MAG TPA: polyprenyl synthetase family protein [Patescibacteria group bacterium]|nr:polyprenyl synthetase family protein [Patescibacteria group bacterium]